MIEDEGAYLGTFWKIAFKNSYQLFGHILNMGYLIFSLLIFNAPKSRCCDSK